MGGEVGQRYKRVMKLDESWGKFTVLPEYRARSGYVW